VKPRTAPVKPRTAVVAEIAVLRCMCPRIPCACGAQLHRPHDAAEAPFSCPACGRFYTADGAPQVTRTGRLACAEPNLANPPRARDEEKP